MALTLLQYADYLDTRDLPWPAPPKIHCLEAQPRLIRLPGLKAVTWSVYGTLLAIQGGELWFEHPDPFVMYTALSKTIQEFKMWGCMSRKPGQPADHLKQVYTDLLVKQKLQPSGGEKYPELQSDLLWEAFIKRLLQNDYTFNAGFFGALNEFSRKVAYFFHASIQGTAAYPGAVLALRQVKSLGLVQGIIANTQCFTLVQLERALLKQDAGARLDDLIDPGIRACSHELRARQPSEKLFRSGLQALAKGGISPHEVLHIGSHVSLDVIPARRIGMRTALFARDKSSEESANEEPKGMTGRPDVVMTDLLQLSEVIG
jgi:FMN phosphatase YigB (HAD superfamily)